MEIIPVRRAPFTTQEDWLVLVWIVAMHIGAIAAFWTFSWAALGVCLFLWWLTGGIGICLGYHRYFTHRSFATPRWVEYMLGIIGCMAGESGPIAWVAAHRYHHTYSDTDRDPHSPYKDRRQPVKSFLWAHIVWLFTCEKFLADYEQYKRYAPYMARDRFLVWLDRYHMVPPLVLAAALYALGGWPYIVWGIFVRSVLLYHSTWLVNSAAHVWGYRSHKTSDESRNNWWVALLTFGEGWHNNHHAFQRSARHGFRWWEVDPTFMAVQVLWIFGLASRIQLPVEGSEEGLTRVFEVGIEDGGGGS